MSPTPKAVVMRITPLHNKRRRLLLMKRAARLIARPCSLQIYMRLQRLHQIYPRAEQLQTLFLQHIHMLQLYRSTPPLSTPINLKKIFIRNARAGTIFFMGKKRTSLTKLPDAEGKEELKPLAQPALNELREKIKEAMIPLLIQIFHLRQNSAEALSLDDNPAERESEAIKKLVALKRDLTHLSLWCTSCLSQVEKALSPPRPERPKQCATAKKSSNLHFTQLHTAENLPPSTSSLLKRLVNGEKRAQESADTHLARSPIRRVFSLAFRRNPRT